MSIDKMREEFEVWLLEEHGLEAEWQAERNCFKEFPAHLAHQAWQASRAAVVFELPEAEAAPRNSSSYREGLADGVERGLDQARKAIEAAGLKVKP